jgi:hypothetical protein
MPTTVPNVYVEIDGNMTPLRSLDWVVRRPCKCLEGMLYARSTSQGEAWQEFYEGRPQRAALIRQRIKDGWTVTLQDRGAACEEMLNGPACNHETP